MENVIEDRICIIAGNLRKIREYRGYSQEYLGLKLGISQNGYSKIELGYSSITVKKLIQISLVLGVDPSSLFTEEVVQCVK